MLKNRSIVSPAFALLLLLSVSFGLMGCGKNYYFAGRNLPPSGVANRVLIAVQNPGPFTAGALLFVDAYYDIRHPYNNQNGSFSIGGFSGKNPVSIQNFPEEQTGAVFSEGDGSLATVDYANEKAGSVLTGQNAPIATSIFVSRNQQYVVAANQAIHSLTVIDRGLGQQFFLNVPGIYRVSINPSGTLALGFVQNSNDVFSVVRLTQPQKVQYSTPAAWQAAGFQDCEPQNLPQYCAARVTSNGAFDRPTKAVFSSDGQSIYVLNCGPECGGSQAGIVTVPITPDALNGNNSGPSGINLQAGPVLPIPGGATDALQNGNTLYVSGQQLQPDGLFAGFLTVVNMSTGQIAGTYSISDGTHTKMLFADDNTLWIGSQRCQEGERYKGSQSGASVQFGCLTMFNTANNAVSIDAYKGDLTGVTAVTGLHKIYVAEGGQVHIYNTTDGAERDNSNVAVTGTAYDVAYMDAPSDGDNANY